MILAVTGHRPYRMKHALVCNPHLGTSTIQDWAKRGNLPHGTHQQGRVNRLSFSLSELAYLRLLSYLSVFNCLGGNTIAITERGPTPVSSSTEILDAIESYRWEVLVQASISQVPKHPSSYRSKRRTTLCTLTLCSDVRQPSSGTTLLIDCHCCLKHTTTTLNTNPLAYWE